MCVIWLQNLNAEYKNEETMELLVDDEEERGLDLQLQSSDEEEKHEKSYAVVTCPGYVVSIEFYPGNDLDG